MASFEHISGGSGVDLDRHAATRIESASAATVRIAVVAARFNQPIVDGLVDGALDVLHGAGLARESVSLLRVPGAWELPLAVAWLARSGRCDAIVAIGCVIRGETSHFDVIVNESARGLAQVALESAVPVANGVLACDDEAQARARSGPGHTNKGREAALAALEMAALRKAFA